MINLFIASVLIFALPFCSPAAASQQYAPEAQKQLTADELNKILYDSFAEYVFRRHSIQLPEKIADLDKMIANNNLSGILKRFFWELQVSSEDEIKSIVSSLMRAQDDITAANAKINILNQKIEMLTQHVGNLLETLKENERLKTQQKNVFKK